MGSSDATTTDGGDVKVMAVNMGRPFHVMNLVSESFLTFVLRYIHFVILEIGVELVSFKDIKIKELSRVDTS